MTVEHWLAVATLVIGVPLNVLVTVRLWSLSRAYPRIRVLRERALVALVVLLLVLVFGLIFLNNDFAVPPLDTTTTKFVTRGAVLTLAILPAVYWLYLYRHSR